MPRKLGRLALVLLCALPVLAAVGAGPRPAGGTTTLYPDLKTLPPHDLRFGTATIDGTTHHVLRFSNTAWNAGQGPLELRGDPNSNQGYQRLYNDDGSSTTLVVPNGAFEYHAAHDHWHFRDFAGYELWTRAEYKAWLDSGRNQGQAQRRGAKTTFCIMDVTRVQALPGSPRAAAYAQCNQDVQGLSVGWGDEYRYDLAGQWVDLGTSRLPNGDYVLRSVADPKDLLEEGSSTREGAADNEGVTCFAVKRNRIRTTGC